LHTFLFSRKEKYARLPFIPKGFHKIAQGQSRKGRHLGQSDLKNSLTLKGLHNQVLSNPCRVFVNGAGCSFSQGGALLCPGLFSFALSGQCNFGFPTFCANIEDLQNYASLSVSAIRFLFVFLFLSRERKRKGAERFLLRSTPYINRIAHFEGVLKNIFKIFSNTYKIQIDAVQVFHCVQNVI